MTALRQARLIPPPAQSPPLRNALGKSPSSLRAGTAVVSFREREAMTKLQEADHLLSQLNPAEKSQLLQWIVRDLGDSFPGIETDPEICGGEARIVRTRIPVW